MDCISRSGLINNAGGRSAAYFAMRTENPMQHNHGGKEHAGGTVQHTLA